MVAFNDNVCQDHLEPRGIVEVIGFNGRTDIPGHIGERLNNEDQYTAVEVTYVAVPKSEVPSSPLGTPDFELISSKDYPICRSTFISSFALVLVVCLLLVLGKNYIKHMLLWMETLDEWIIVLLFIALFTLVSLPCTWGYILLNLAGGYLFGLVKGIIVVMLSVAIGVLIAHILMKRFLNEFVSSKLVFNDNLRATLAVVGGPQAFKVVAFMRLTPIPFGLQNALFGISSIGTLRYILASMMGLFPTQVLNVYLGSTLRSMEDILADDSTATTGYIMFVIQVLISIALTVYVVRRAREELRKTMQNEILADCASVKAINPTYEIRPNATDINP